MLSPQFLYKKNLNNMHVLFIHPWIIYQVPTKFCGYEVSELEAILDFFFSS